MECHVTAAAEFSHISQVSREKSWALPSEKHWVKGDIRSWGHILPSAVSLELDRKRRIWIFWGLNGFALKIWVKPSSPEGTNGRNMHLSPCGTWKKCYLKSLSLVSWIITFTRGDCELNFPLCSCCIQHQLSQDALQTISNSATENNTHLRTCQCFFGSQFMHSLVRTSKGCN